MDNKTIKKPLTEITRPEYLEFMEKRGAKPTSYHNWKKACLNIAKNRYGISLYDMVSDDEEIFQGFWDHIPSEKFVDERAKKHNLINMEEVAKK